VFVNDVIVPLMKEVAARVKSIKVCHFRPMNNCCGEALYVLANYVWKRNLISSYFTPSAFVYIAI